MALAIFKSDDPSVGLLQTSWSAAINPLLNNPINTGIILKSVKLTTGTNVINTTLGKNLTGWFIVRQRAAATVYDNQDNNKTPNLTLILISSAPTVIDLEVF